MKIENMAEQDFMEVIYVLVIGSDRLYLQERYANQYFEYLKTMYPKVEESGSEIVFHTLNPITRSKGYHNKGGIRFENGRTARHFHFYLKFGEDDLWFQQHKDQYHLIIYECTPHPVTCSLKNLYYTSYLLKQGGFMFYCVGKNLRTPEIPINLKPLSEYNNIFGLSSWDKNDKIWRKNWDLDSDSGEKEQELQGYLDQQKNLIVPTFLEAWNMDLNDLEFYHTALKGFGDKDKDKDKVNDYFWAIRNVKIYRQKYHQMKKIVQQEQKNDDNLEKED